MREIIATDTNRARLSKLAPRAERAGATSNALLDGGRELGQLADWRGRPTSCWSMRRARAAAPGAAIPKGRWRLTPERLDRVVALQARLLDLAAPSWSSRAARWSMPLARSVPRRGRAGEAS
jgi:16S rRNA (cytosine967-C5)-methyltransferase